MTNPCEVLDGMSITFLNRHEIYGDNYLQIGRVLEAMFPDGITIKTADDHNRHHAFLMMVVKITRLASSGINHQDSAHDCAVYGAMLETLLENGKTKLEGEVAKEPEPIPVKCEYVPPAEQGIASA